MKWKMNQTLLWLFLPTSVTGLWVALWCYISFYSGWDQMYIYKFLFLTGLLLIPGLGGVLTCYVFGIINCWRRFGKRSVLWLPLPAGLLILSFWLAPLCYRSGSQGRAERIKAQLPQYEKLLAVVLRNDRAEMESQGMTVTTNSSDEREYARIQLPVNLYKLAYVIDVYRYKGEKDPTVVFVRAAGLTGHYIAYVYRADGKLTNEIERLDCYLSCMINSNWCDVSHSQ